MSLYKPSEFKQVWEKAAEKLSKKRSKFLMKAYEKVEKKYAYYRVEVPSTMCSGIYIDIGNWSLYRQKVSFEAATQTRVSCQPSKVEQTL